MTEDTVRLVDTALRGDRTLGASERRRLVERLRGGLGSEAQPDCLLRRKEAARLLGRSAKAIDRLASVGVLRKVVFPGCKRGAGYRLSDIAALIAGNTCPKYSVNLGEQDAQ